MNVKRLTLEIFLGIGTEESQVRVLEIIFLWFHCDIKPQIIILTTIVPLVISVMNCNLQCNNSSTLGLQL